MNFYGPFSACVAGYLLTSPLAFFSPFLLDTCVDFFPTETFVMQRPSSPRSQLSTLLLGKLGVPENSLDAVMAEAQEKLTVSDAENKLHNRKLYLVRWHTIRCGTA